MSTDTTEFETVEWVYLGRRIFKGGKLSHVFQSDDDIKIFSKAPRHPVVGDLYAIEWNGQSARLADAKRLSATHDERLSEWRLRDREALTNDEARKATKRLHDRNGDLGELTLDDLKAIMSKQPQHIRAGTVATVLSYLGAV